MLKTRAEIEQWLDSMGIKQYTINEDLTVDIFGNVNISDKNLTEIPVQFGEVGGEFNCSNNLLTTLEGVPKSVGRALLASNNELTSAKGISKYIGQYCNLGHNPIKHIEHWPETMPGKIYFNDKKGVLNNFIDFYQNEYSNIKELYLSGEEIKAGNLKVKIELCLENKPSTNKPRGKI